MGYRLFSKIPQYTRPAVTSIIVAIDSLLLGFAFSLFFVVAKTFFRFFSQKKHPTLNVMVRGFVFGLDRFMSFLKAIPIMAQALIFYALFKLVPLLALHSTFTLFFHCYFCSCFKCSCCFNRHYD
ncbi:hypothetical protein ['Camptotheca acuminata' phytoplasma]|uniref:hypothetical protein n=1 Tax='Camptotheca acuminata' phytoplasma TaxID=3239192 RepID=UPI00351AA286